MSASAQTASEYDLPNVRFMDILTALGAEEWAALPVLDLGERNGSTGYLDFIHGEEMSAPVMRGKDAHGRKFISMRYTISGVDAYGIEGAKYMYFPTSVETAFERYSNSSEWTSGGAEFVIQNSRAKSTDVARMETLLKTGTLTLANGTRGPANGLVLTLV